MTIKSIKLENFTVFENIKCEFKSGINIFIGENGTGKTHLLKTLYAIAKSDFKKQEGQLAKFSYFTDSLEDNHNEYHFTNWASILGRYFRNMGRVSLNRNLDREKPYSISVENDSQSFCFTSSDSFLASYIKHDSSVFIPAKDMLTHARGLLSMSKKYSQDMPFDKTLLTIIEKAEEWKLDKSQFHSNALSVLEKEIGGEVIQENGDFYILNANGIKIPFALEAEGIKKLGLLWLLIMNGNLSSGKVLFWDEPESNINPKLIPVLVDVLVELSKNGVQVFLATHEFNLIQYLNLKRKADNNVLFISLYKDDVGAVSVETAENYVHLEHNSITEANIKLLKDDYDGVL